MEESKKKGLKVVLPNERLQFRFRLYASQVPPDYQKATIMLMSDSGSSTLAETSDAPVRAGNCRWKETLKYENSFPTSGSKKPHFVKFTVTQNDQSREVIGETRVDLSEFDQAGNGMLEQKTFTLQNDKGNFHLNVTVQCSILPNSASETTPTPTPTGSKIKGLVTLLRRSSSGDNLLADKSSSSEQTLRVPVTPPNNQQLKAQANQKSSPIASRQHSSELDGTNSPPVLPKRKNSEKRPQRATSVPVRFASEHFSDEAVLPASVDDLRGELKKAEEAIDELQAESVVWRKSSRSLSKEVENLRQQLAEAMKQDQMAEMEIQNLVDERDYLTFELEKSQVESETKANEISELKEKLKDTESDLVVQKAFVARLTLQAKSQSEVSNLSSPTAAAQNENQLGDELAQLEHSQSLKSEYQEAIEAIEELQAESVTWKTTSRTLSKEVELLRKHLSEAAMHDQAVDEEVQEILNEKEAIRTELDRERYNHDLTRSTLKMLEEEVSLQKEMIQVLLMQVKAFHPPNQQPRLVKGELSEIEQFLYSRGMGV